MYCLIKKKNLKEIFETSVYSLSSKFIDRNLKRNKTKLNTWLPSMYLIYYNLIDAVHPQYSWILSSDWSGGVYLFNP